MSCCIIYALHHEHSKWVYVGQSRRGIRRSREHGRASNLKKNLPLCRWIKHIRAAGNNYTVTILEEPTLTDLDAAERFFIGYFRAIGIPLLNCTGGGEGIHNPSDETRRKMGDKKRGRPLSPEHCVQLSVAQKARQKIHPTVFPVAAIKNSATSRRGKELSPEHCAKLSVSRTGKTPSVETRAKMSAWQTGRKRPPFSAEWRARLSESKRGKTHSPETKHKMSEAAKRRRRNERSGKYE